MAGRFRRPFLCVSAAGLEMRTVGRYPVLLSKTAEPFVKPHKQKDGFSAE